MLHILVGAVSLFQALLGINQSIALLRFGVCTLSFEVSTINANVSKMRRTQEISQVWLQQSVMMFVTYSDVNG